MVIVHLSDNQRKIVSVENGETVGQLLKRFCNESGVPETEYQFYKVNQNEAVPSNIVVSELKIREIRLVKIRGNLESALNLCSTNISNATERRKTSAPQPPADCKLKSKANSKRTAPKPPVSDRSYSPIIEIPAPPQILNCHQTQPNLMPYNVSVSCETDPIDPIYDSIQTSRTNSMSSKMSDDFNPSVMDKRQPSESSLEFEECLEFRNSSIPSNVSSDLPKMSILFAELSVNSSVESESSQILSKIHHNEGQSPIIDFYDEIVDTDKLELSLECQENISSIYVKCQIDDEINTSLENLKISSSKMDMICPPNELTSSNKPKADQIGSEDCVNIKNPVVVLRRLKLTNAEFSENDSNSVNDHMDNSGSVITQLNDRNQKMMTSWAVVDMESDDESTKKNTDSSVVSKNEIRKTEPIITTMESTNRQKQFWEPVKQHKKFEFRSSVVMETKSDVVSQEKDPEMIRQKSVVSMIIQDRTEPVSNRPIYAPRKSRTLVFTADTASRY